MKTATFAILIVGLLFVTGCPTITGGKKGPDFSKMTPKEIAAYRAKQLYGENKPYTYEWTEEKGEYIVKGKALVVPGERYTGEED